MTHRLFIFLANLLLVSCTKEKTDAAFKQDFVELSTHKLATYSITSESKYLVVFESGLGDDHGVWQTKKLAQEIGKTQAVLLYDRAGYGKSTIDDGVRDVKKLSAELSAIVNKYATGRKVILIGHSLGGLTIRDFAIKYPEQTAGLLFIDPSHEYYNQPTQEVEDIIYNAFKSASGANSGAAKEARQLIENFAYTSGLPDLPNIPVVVLTSMKKDQSNTISDQTYNKTRQDWYQAHELLKKGVTDYTHVQTTQSGHYIMNDEPELVRKNVDLLISKLP